MRKLDKNRIVIGPELITIRRNGSWEKLFATLGLFMALGLVFGPAGGLLMGILFGLVSHYRPDVKIHKGSRQILDKLRFGVYTGYDFSQVTEIKRLSDRRGRPYYVLVIATSKWSATEVALTGPLPPDRPVPWFIAELLQAVDEMVMPRRRLEDLLPTE